MSNDAGVQDGGSESDSNANSEDGAGSSNADNLVDPTGQGNEGEGAALPPELEEVKKNLVRGFHEKTQKLAQRQKELEDKYSAAEKDASALRTIANEEWFKKALAQERKRLNGVVDDEMTDEQFQSITADKKNFQAYFNHKVKELLDARMSQEIGNIRRPLQDLRRESDIARLRVAHGKHFSTALDNGDLDKDVEGGYNYEDAYARFALRNPKSTENEESVEDRAERLLAEKRGGTVNRGGSSGAGKGVRTYPVQSLNEALDLIWDKTQAGEKFSIKRK